jgi:type IV pilus assembly protein PilX
MRPNSRIITSFHKNQSGVVLVVSLIILLLLTLIGLTGMQTTGLEEKMASNMRDKNLAFQAAEATLKVGEGKIQDLSNSNTSAGFFNCLHESQGDGLFKKEEPDIDTVWSSSDVLCGNDPNSVCRPDDPHQSKYIIQCLGQEGLYRITAYAKGATNDSVVILQSVFNLKPPEV